jgi:hypothetical protein
MALDRFYRTGDFGQYLPDGSLEILGRADQQVKLRGIRIELGEIESVLELYPDVKETVVVSRESATGDKQLIGYVTTKPVLEGSSPNDVKRELHSFLKAKLPAYMIPSIVLLDEIPRTPNGKVDRQALPLPEVGRAHLDEALVAPRTVTEALLAAIWTIVLGVEQVGVHDNFFELGGHSLLATRLISRIRQVFQVDLPLRTVFETPTIASLAEYIDIYQVALNSVDTSNTFPRRGHRSPLARLRRRKMPFKLPICWSVRHRCLLSVIWWLQRLMALPGR